MSCCRDWILEAETFVRRIISTPIKVALLKTRVEEWSEARLSLNTLPLVVLGCTGKPLTEGAAEMGGIDEAPVVGDLDNGGALEDGAAEVGGIAFQSGAHDGLTDAIAVDSQIAVHPSAHWPTKFLAKRADPALPPGKAILNWPTVVSFWGHAKTLGSDSLQDNC